jgi:TolB-like protein
MYFAEAIALESAVDTQFSSEAIDKQLRKIIEDPSFVDSDILKNFLVFVVRETLNGNANRLKEYTIAVKVLAKPTTFRPQENGIVRIHAGRLRRALNNYYCQGGVYDEIRISIPKGGYIPVFANNDERTEPEMKIVHKTIVIGVAPFKDSCSDPSRVTFADGMGVQLSTSLMLVNHFSVVAHYTIKNLFLKMDNIGEVGTMVGAHFMITGHIQRLKKNLRVHLQLIRVQTGQIIWSQMYEREFSESNLFNMQDALVAEAINEISTLNL